MRIALVPTVSAPVCRDSRGSVEAWTWLLARELRRMGHELTVFACGGSEADAEVIVTQPGPYGAPGGFDDWQLCEWVNLCAAVEQSHRFDVIHTQAYLWGIPLQKVSRAPMLHTLHIVPDGNAIRLWQSHPESRVSAISAHQWSEAPDLKPLTVILHAVDPSQFSFCETPEDYLLYLGRFTSGKGPLLAIETATKLQIPLILAGPENQYFRERVKPLIDGKLIRYAGYAPPQRRKQLLRGARALLYPIQYPEAFGLVLVEAMLCGTPVAALNLGAVPEIIEQGIAGILCGRNEDFEVATLSALGLNRAAVHVSAARRFSAEEMSSKYVRLYERIVSQ